MRAPAAVVLVACALACGAAAVWPHDARRAEPTVCDDASCRCDAHSRVLCNCTADYDEVTIRPMGPYRVLPTATEIIISGCARVYFLPNSINGTLRLRRVELRHVRHLELHEGALLWAAAPAGPGLRLLLDNCTVGDVASHTFRGRFDEILIRNSRVRSMRPFAFSSLIGVQNIELTDNEFDAIDIQTFKKFTTDSFVLRGGSVRALPGRFLSDVEVLGALRVDGVRVGTVRSMAFLVRGARRVGVENNVIDVLEGDAFHVAAAGPFTFRNNTVGDVREGAFLGVGGAAGGLQALLLDNNTVRDATPHSFLYDRATVRLRIDGLNLARECDCALVREWLGPVAAQAGSVACDYSLEGRFVSLPTYAASRCGRFKETFWMYAGAALAAAVLAGAAAVLLVVRREKKKKKKLRIVLPDGKTYRETELHVIVERAELLTTDL